MGVWRNVVGNALRHEIEHRFQQLCAESQRAGVIGFSPVEAARLLPAQAQYLRQKLNTLAHGGGVTAVTLGLLYHENEILAVPGAWQSKLSPNDRWNDYARAYEALNRLLNHFSTELAAQFGGVAEQPTIEGWVKNVEHVTDYFPNCVSHCSFAEAAGVGWRGRHGLIVTPQVGPALRFATVFIPGSIAQPRTELAGCGDCSACLEVCPILREAAEYREACRRRLSALGLEDEVCGICVRVCWERITMQLRGEQSSTPRRSGTSARSTGPAAHLSTG
jgi:epoxyqueuosine reductase QueG